MLVRTRLILAFAAIMVFSLIAIGIAFFSFQSSQARFNEMQSSILSRQGTMERINALARELADLPITYVFVQDGDERAELLEKYETMIEELSGILDAHVSLEGEILEAHLRAATALINTGQNMIALVDRDIPLTQLEAAQDTMETSEADLQRVINEEIDREVRALDAEVGSQRMNMISLWATFFIVGSSLVAGSALLLLLKAINQPIEQLTRHARQMATGDYTQPVTMVREDEFGVLATAFNSMAEAVENRERSLRELNTTLEARVEVRTQELVQARDKAQTILTHTSDALVLLNANRTIEQINPAFTDLFNYTEVDCLGMPIETLVADRDQRTALIEALDQMARDGHLQVELRCQRQDGTTFIADATFGRVGMASPDEQQILCSFHDITRQKVTQEELEEALRKERELGALKSRFVTMVSHEFRTPLAVIQSSSDIIKLYWDRLNPESRVTKLDEIQAQINHMTSLLEDFLTMSHVEVTGVILHPAPLDLAGFFEQLIAEMQLLTGSQRIVVTTCGTPTTPPLDEKLFRQAMINLLTNAMKYSPNQAPVTVEVVYDPAQTTIHVSDQGIGIPPEDRAHIFDSFHRGTNVENIVGTGLGLAIVKRAVEAHGGHLSFQSVVGKGTKFSAVFPIFSLKESLHDQNSSH